MKKKNEMEKHAFARRVTLSNELLTSCFRLFSDPTYFFTFYPVSLYRNAFRCEVSFEDRMKMLSVSGFDLIFYLKMCDGIR